MFGTIRRHQSWLWVFIIGVMIVSLLYWVDQRPRGADGSVIEAPEVAGKKVTPKMLRDAQTEARLLYYLNFGKWPEMDAENARQNGFDLEEQAYLRLLRVGLAEQAGVEVSDQAIAAIARRLLGDYPLDRLEKEVLAPAGVTLEDFERFLANDAAIQQLSSVVGAAGRMVTPTEAEALYRERNQEMAGELVLFSISNYLSKVVITNGALTNFFQQQMARYRVPEKVRVSYVLFPRTNFLAEAEQRISQETNYQANLLQRYFAAGTNNFKDTNGNVLSESNALVRLRENDRDQVALSLAARRANEFANKLYDQQPLKVENFEKLAAAENMPIQVSQPFEMEEGPTNLDVSPKFAEVAFQLNSTNNPVSVQPIAGREGIYIIALKDQIPGRFQPFEEVKERVAEDYRRMQAFTLARNDGTNLMVQATNGIASGRTFSEVAQKLGFKAEALPPISQSTETLTNLQERLNIRQLRSVVFSLEPGKVSSYVPNPPDGGYVVYVRAKLPINEQKMREELPKFLAELRYQKQNEIFNQWFRKQLEKANLPINRSRPRAS
jgi:hypothetical protein